LRRDTKRGRPGGYQDTKTRRREDTGTPSAI
jgi:hypothetical protein